MDKDFLIKLTNNLYRLTLLFPKKEPLRYKMRELADDILVNQTEEKLEILNSFFEVAKSQNWVSPSNVLEIQQEYSKIGGEIKKLSSSTPARTEMASSEVEPRKIEGNGSLERNPRQQKILEILKEKGKAQVWEIKQIFPEVTKRTLRRDFEGLLNQGLIERIGERNETFYQLKVIRT